MQVPLDESDEQDGTPLHYAAKKGFVGLAKVLAGAGATIDVRNVKSMTPLHLVSETLAAFVRGRARFRKTSTYSLKWLCCGRVLAVQALLLPTILIIVWACFPSVYVVNTWQPCSSYRLYRRAVIHSGYIQVLS